jgi:type I restriction enzyme R subunit
VTLAKAKTEELKNAITEYIQSHQEEDPELYERLGEKLEKLLKEYRENWENLSKELQNLIGEIREGREGEDNYGLDPQSVFPFLGLLKKEVFGVKDLSELDIQEVDLIVQTTKDIVGRVKDDIQLVDFWNNLPAQKRLKGFIASHLLTEFKDNSGIFDKRTAIAQNIMELAFHLSERLGHDNN